MNVAVSGGIGPRAKDGKEERGKGGTEREKSIWKKGKGSRTIFFLNVPTPLY